MFRIIILTLLSTSLVVFTTATLKHPPPNIRRIQQEFQNRLSTNYSSLLLEQISTNSTTLRHRHLQTATSHDFIPLRILFDTSGVDRLLTTFASETNNKISFLKNTVLPAVNDVWSSHLKVLPIGTFSIPKNICFGGLNIFRNLVVDNHDLVIFVTADSCSNEEGALAYAYPCAMDALSDRPVVGKILEWFISFLSMHVISHVYFDHNNVFIQNNIILAYYS